MDTSDRVERLQRRVDRERERRAEAERIAETSTRELYERQRELKELAGSLEQRVDQRTRQLEERVAQQSVLAKVSRKALEGSKMDQLMEDVCSSTHEVLDTDYTDVFELRSEHDDLILRAGVGWPQDYIDEETIPAGSDDQAGYTVERRGPVIVENVHEDPRFDGPKLLDDMDIKSGVTVVIPGPEDPWGVFGVHSKTPRGFNEDDAAFVESISYTLSQAIHTLRSRRELEQYAHRLERANQELETFAHIISHDLQEPIRMVNNYIHLLEESYEGDLDEERETLLHHAKTGATRSQAMIQTLRRYTRLDAASLEKEPVNLDRVVDDVLASLANLIDETDTRIHRDPLPTVKADPPQTSQVFQNLITNAIKYAKPGQPPEVKIQAQPLEAAWQLSVEDNGVGMDPDRVDELFQMFQQGPKAESGEGVGLAVCKKIVERHGGRIWIQTEQAEGSTVHFTLPRAHGD